jgi:hypothetical protein
VHGRNGRIQKGCGCAKIIETLRITPPPYLDATDLLPTRLSSSLLLSSTTPFGRLDVSKLVDVERMPYPSVASRLSAAISNTFNGIDDIVDILKAHFAANSGMFCTRGLRKHHEIRRYSPSDIIDP